MNAVLWIRIQSDRHNFAGSVSISTKRQAKLYGFQKILYTVQMAKIFKSTYDTYDVDEKVIKVFFKIQIL